MTRASWLTLQGSIELGVITQSTGAFNNVLNDLSIIVNQFESLSAFSAGLGRLASFVERMESYKGAQANATFCLDEATLANLTRAAKKRSIGDLILYGQRGAPPAPPCPPGPRRQRTPAAARASHSTTGSRPCFASACSACSGLSQEKAFSTA